MSDPHTRSEIIERLRQVQRGVSETVEAILPAQFEQGSAEAWSASDYLKHLLLSVKPFARAMTYPPDALRRRFGAPLRPPLAYAELVAAYQARLDDGIRAEDYENILPTTFRMPEDVGERTVDRQAYLVELWDEAHDRLIDGLAVWSESDLDSVAILHPALGAISVREMLYFTIFHNTHHWGDIRAAASRAGDANATG
jgi:uncharacterized damage-inducible protein DinB